MAKERITPEFTVKVGGIQLAVWANKADKGVFRSITIDKSYKDGDEWKRTKSFKPNDLALINLGINEILRHLYIKGDVSADTVSSSDTTPF